MSEGKAAPIISLREFIKIVSPSLYKEWPRGKEFAEYMEENDVADVRVINTRLRGECMLEYWVHSETAGCSLEMSKDNGKIIIDYKRLPGDMLEAVNINRYQDPRKIISIEAAEAALDIVRCAVRDKELKLGAIKNFEANYILFRTEKQKDQFS
jgi:hypothetical protein